MEPILEQNQKLTIKKPNRNINNNEILSELINNLYISLKPGCPKNYNLPTNFVNLILRIISTNFNIIKNEENILLNSLLEKVYQISKNDEDVINQFQNLYDRLTQKRRLTKRWGVLYILNHFSNKNFNKNMNFSATNTLQQNFLKCYETLNNKIENDLSEIFFEDNNNNYRPNNFILTRKMNINPNCKERCEYYLNNLSPISDINSKFCENESQINAGNKNSNIYFPIQYPLVINPSKTSLTITEKDIINDLIYVFGGINGKYISYDMREDAFILNKIIPWSEEIYNIVNNLSELGWLYKKIMHYIELFKKEKTSKSQFVQSFIYAIQKELDEYFKLISFFKKMNNSNTTGKKLNLKKLFLWTLEPKEKLKWIATCCETSFNLKGAAIFSQTYSLKNFLGNNTYLNNILNEISKPFLSFVINWIKYGNLEDPYKEFFVNVLDGIKDDDIWNLKYQLVAKNVPNFMKREKTLKIFEVGKGIHFLRNYCNEKFNLSNLKENLDKLIKDNNDNKNKNISDINSLNDCYDFINYIFNEVNNEKILDISLIEIINKNIDIIHNLINEETVKIIMIKFKFNSNLESINKYLLLGQGDMMQTLIESLFEELDKQANNLAKHNLESYLITAIKSSNSDIKDAENIKKLNIILLNPTQGDIGWDIFCLEYKVDLPLNVIFSNKLLKDYQKLFLFFWKIKRIKYGQINYIWKKIKNLNSDSTKTKHNSFLKKLIQTSIAFNQEIVHFITNLHNYFALEVLETQYKKLKSDLSKIKNLDELINIHKAFVENIKRQCLLDEDNKNIIIKISELFEIILQFKKVFDVLYSFVFEINYGNNFNFSRIKNIEEYLKQIDNLYKEYKLNIIEFIQIIDLIGKNNIKYLSMKLDYNYYYSTIEKEKKDIEDLKVIKNIDKEKIRRKILNDDDNISRYERSEDSKNNYEENNNIIDNNKFIDVKKENIENNINKQDIMEEEEEEDIKEDKKINNEDDEEKDDKFNKEELDNYENMINLNDNKSNNDFNSNNLNKKINNYVYTKQKFNDSKYNTNNINIVNEGNINNIIKNKDFNSKVDEYNYKTYQYEGNNYLNEDELNDNDEEKGEDLENNLNDIDEEDKIVTNIVPKIYGISSKTKTKNQTNEKK